MKIRTVLLVALVVLTTAMGFISVKMKREKVALQSQVGAVAETVKKMESQVKDLEDKATGLKDQADKAALKAAEEKLRLADGMKAQEVRLTYDPLEQFQISPSVSPENGWLMIGGEHTYTLKGFTNATKVRFFWADASQELKPELLAEDTNSVNGWAWTGTLPFGNMKALWAEIHFANGLKIYSSVLPIRSTAK